MIHPFSLQRALWRPWSPSRRCCRLPSWAKLRRQRSTLGLRRVHRGVIPIFRGYGRTKPLRLSSAPASFRTNHFFPKKKPRNWNSKQRDRTAADGTSPPGQRWRLQPVLVRLRNRGSLDPAIVAGCGSADGRVPVMPEAEAKRDDTHARSTDSYEFMSLWTAASRAACRVRCSLPPTTMPIDPANSRICGDSL